MDRGILFLVALSTTTLGANDGKLVNGFTLKKKVGQWPLDEGTTL